MVDDEAKSKPKRPPLAIGSEDEFEALMESIDQQLIADEVGIPARPMMAGLYITKQYDIVLDAIPPTHPIQKGVFTPEQISLRVYVWMERRYGPRLKVNWQIGRVVLPLRGGRYTIQCPVIYGSVKFICVPDQFGQEENRVGIHTAPICNILNLIEGFTADLSRSLTAEEVVKIGFVHAGAMAAFLALSAIGDQPYVNEALGDLNAAVHHLMDEKPQFGLSKWSSLQAVEKLLKSYIVIQKGAVQHHHRLKDHVTDAVKLGLSPPPQKCIDDLHCTAGVRYGEVAVKGSEAVAAHLTSLDMCEYVAQSIGYVLKRQMPDCPEPMIEGMPGHEFLKKYRHE